MNSHAVRAQSHEALVASPAKAAVAMITFALLWAAVELAGSVTIHKVSAWQVVFTRYSVHLALVLAICWGNAPWRTQRLRVQLLRSAMMLIMPASFILASERGASLSWVLAVFWSAPLLLLIFAMVIEHERPATTTWLAAALAWLVGWSYYLPSGAPPKAGIVGGLVMAGSFAIYVVMTRTLRDEPLRTNLFYTAVIPWLGLIPILPHTWISPSLTEIGGMIFIGAAGLLGLWAIDRATHAAPAAASAPFVSAQVAITALFEIASGRSAGIHQPLLFAGLMAAALLLAWAGMSHTRSAERP